MTDRTGSHRPTRSWLRPIGICLIVLLMHTVVMPTPMLTAQNTATPCQFKIGIITSLTGEYQNRAAELTQGYDLARDDINAAGGVLGCPLELVYRDDASLSSGGASALQMLVETDEVLLVAGTIVSVITLDLVPLASDYRIPLLAHNSTNSLITDLGYEWVFRTIPSAWDALDQLIGYINQLSSVDAPSFALLYEDSSFGQDAYVTLLSSLKRYGISLVAALPIPTDVDDFPHVLDRLAESGANMLVLAGASVNDAITTIQQIERANLNFAAYLSPGGAYNSAQFLNLPAADYLISPIPWIDSIPLTDQMSGQSTDEFLAHFGERYGTAPTFRTVNAYVNIYIAKTAIESSLTMPPENARELEGARLLLRDTLRALRLEQTLFGPIDFDAFGQNDTSLLVTQWVDGQFTILSPDSQTTGTLILPAPTWAERQQS